MKVVISQPMFFPWLGIFEQMRLADVFVHYDDVQMPMGRSFISRVQIKTATGPQWLTAPIHRPHAKALIKDVLLSDDTDWRRKHLRTLEANYASAPCWSAAKAIAEDAYSHRTESLAGFNIHAIESIARFFGIKTVFKVSGSYATDTRSSEHLLHLVKLFNGDTYITGHGARNYIDHELFERHGIEVRYMNYLRIPYSQRFDGFDPHVSILDVIANMGHDGADLMRSETLNWRDFIGG